MVLMLDSMSKRYGCLPSQALANANTFDVFILTRALEYTNKKNSASLGPAPPPDLSTEELLGILEQSKGK